MKIIKIIVGIAFIVGLVFPTIYEYTLPPLNEQKINFQTLNYELQLSNMEGISFNKIIKTKRVFDFLYYYDNKKYTKLDIKNLLFENLYAKGWKSKGSGIRPKNIWMLNMENEIYFCSIEIYDESFSMSFTYKGLYD